MLAMQQNNTLASAVFETQAVHHRLEKGVSRTDRACAMVTGTRRCAAVPIAIAKVMHGRPVVSLFGRAGQKANLYKHEELAIVQGGHRPALTSKLRSPREVIAFQRLNDATCHIYLPRVLF